MFYTPRPWLRRPPSDRLHAVNRCSGRNLWPGVKPWRAICNLLPDGIRMRRLCDGCGLLVRMVVSVNEDAGERYYKPLTHPSPKAGQPVYVWRDDGGNTGSTRLGRCDTELGRFGSELKSRGDAVSGARRWGSWYGGVLETIQAVCGVVIRI